MKNRFHIILTAVLTFCLVACETKQEIAPASAPAVPVKTVQPTVKDITVYVDSIGTLAPTVLMEVHPQISGTLTDVLVTEGQWVELGAPLFKIDSKSYSIKVQEAEAQLEMDRVSLHAAERKLARLKPLAEKDLISRAEWEEQEAELKKSEAAIALDLSRLENAKMDLDECTIVARTAGRVGKCDAHHGLLVAKDTSLATIAQLDPLRVEFTLTEKEFFKLPKDNLQMEIKPLCASAECKKGEITFLDTHFDSATGQMMVRGKIQNADNAWRPGQSVQVRIPIAITQNTILVPQKAIRYNQEGPYVYVVQEDQTIALRQLILGDEEGLDQVVKEGIASTEPLIVDGHLRLSPGIKVEVKP